MRIRVINSRPNHLQDPIHSIIGKEYEVIINKEYLADFKERGEVNVFSPEFGGEITLNRNEYEVLEG